MRQALLERLEQIGIVPVVVIDDARKAEPLGRALIAGGLPCVEVTLRTPAALEALRILAADPEMLVGAGTVLRPAQVEQALNAGARYIVSPGFSPGVVAECARVGVPVLPGAVTATEIQFAVDAGLDVVKFFPAATAGGVATLAALSGPFREVRFVPTGGIAAVDLPSYLALPCVLAVGGSWLVTQQRLADEAYEEITRLAAHSMAAVREARGSES
jgi:2-dehydro-3-deoxyphosphogluconate aldolase/(4S)-4-hydroxy-2-oxoglutarate aldolase